MTINQIFSMPPLQSSTNSLSCIVCKDKDSTNGLKEEKKRIYDLVFCLTCQKELNNKLRTLDYTNFFTLLEQKLPAGTMQIFKLSITNFLSCFNIMSLDKFLSLALMSGIPLSTMVEIVRLI